ncbi:hypothetical protein PGT21_001971 [Puccinia graminis f. sp. tritici]|uniref:Uncharacterized protein n=1 Tax=Puccinia graminis f. sp. tritici TaxID=56615 RepID=A0A5B0M3B0_PUCGR|nr:hypothetical protein PGT21_001971 [Puccinia graminis f. sp. tritici]
MLAHGEVFSAISGQEFIPPEMCAEDKRNGDGLDGSHARSDFRDSVPPTPVVLRLRRYPFFPPQAPRPALTYRSALISRLEFLERGIRTSVEERKIFQSSRPPV